MCGTFVVSGEKPATYEAVWSDSIYERAKAYYHDQLCSLLHILRRLQAPHSRQRVVGDS